MDELSVKIDAISINIDEIPIKIDEIPIQIDEISKKSMKYRVKRARRAFISKTLQFSDGLLHPGP